MPKDEKKPQAKNFSFGAAFATKQNGPESSIVTLRGNRSEVSFTVYPDLAGGFETGKKYLVTIEEV